MSSEISSRLFPSPTPRLLGRLGLTLILTTTLGAGCDWAAPSEQASGTLPVQRRASELHATRAATPLGEAKAKADVAGPTQREPVALTWYDAMGRAHLAADRSEIPKAALASVVIAPMGAGAKNAMREEVTVADFSGTKPSFTVVDLAKLSQVRSEQTEAELLAAHNKVLVYSAPWCGFCKRVKALLHEWKVPFETLNIEASPAAARALTVKSRAAGLRGGGIPVTDIHGTLVKGFDPARLKRILIQKGVLPPSEAPPPSPKASAKGHSGTH